MPRKAKVVPVMHFTFQNMLNTINSYTDGKTTLAQFVKAFLPQEWEATYVKNDFTEDQKKLIFDIRCTLRDNFPSYNKGPSAQEVFKEMLRSRVQVFMCVGGSARVVG